MSKPGSGDGPDASTKPALTISNVSKSFAGKSVLTLFNLSIATGEIHALLGQNGSGKSTLIKVLSGYHVPEPGGTVTVAGRTLEFGSPAVAHRIGCRFVHQDLALIGTISVLDNLALGSGYPTRFGTIRHGLVLREANEMLSKIGLEVDPRRPMAELPPAQQTGVAIARALYADRANPPSLLVLDEPTATLPKEEVGHLHVTLRAIAATGVGILYVTHHLNEVFELAHNVTVLRDGSIVGTSSVNSTDRKTLVHWLVGEMLERVDHQIAERVHHRPEAEAASFGLQVKGLGVGPIKDLSLSVMPGEIVGLYGLTGSGREAILGAVFGATSPDRGRVEVGGTSVALGQPHAAIATGVGYLPADRKLNGGIMLMSARENLTILNLKPFWSTWRLLRRPEVTEVKEWFARVDVRPRHAVGLPLASFSGGNQQKILFAKWLRQRPRVLLLDEPTQGVDVGAKSELHRQILEAAEAGAAVVVNSNDVEELASLCTRVLVIRDGRIADQLVGERIKESEIDASLHAQTALA